MRTPDGGFSPKVPGRMELWELVARERCRDTLARYTHAGDRFRLNEYVAAFCEDGVLEVRGATPLQGRGAILERFRGGIGKPATSREAQTAAGAKRIVRHNVTNVLFEVGEPGEGERGELLHRLHERRRRPHGSLPRPAGAGGRRVADCPSVRVHRLARARQSLRRYIIVSRPRRFARYRLVPARAGLLAALALVLGSSAGAPWAAAAPTTPAGTTTVDGDVVPTVAHVGTGSFTHPGPLGVGETTLKLPTDGAPVEVWYPATKASVAGKPIATYNVATWLPPALQKLIPAGFAVTYPSGGVTGVPVAPGRYPLIVFSHGYAGFRDQSTFLTAFLASWGFIVAAPDHYSRDLTEVLGGPTAATEKTTDLGDLKATIALMGSEDRTASSAFHGHIDTAKVGAVGHSAGGAAVEALAATDSKVATFIGLAGATVGAFGQTKKGPDSIVPHQPGLLMSGTSDQVVKTSSIVAAYGHLHTPKRLILIRGAGHLVFADPLRGRFGTGRPAGHRSRAQGAHPRLSDAVGYRRLQATRPLAARGVARHSSGRDGAVPLRPRLRPYRPKGLAGSGRRVPGHRFGRTGHPERPLQMVEAAPAKAALAFPAMPAASSAPRICTFASSGNTPWGGRDKG